MSACCMADISKKIYSAMITLFNAAKIIIVHNADRNVLGEILVIK